MNNALAIRRIAVLTVLTAVLFALLLYSLCVSGVHTLSLSECLTALAGNGDSGELFVFRQLRLPRVGAAAGCGILLGIGGAVLQVILRNPLASPDILGISSGGGLAGLALLMFLPDRPEYLGIVTFAGALTMAALIYFAAWKRGVSPGQLVLTGVALSALAGAGNTVLLMLNSDRLTGIFEFTLGGFAGVGINDLKLLTAILLLTVAGVVLLAKKLDLLALGDDGAASLGVNVELLRLAALALAALAAAGSAAVAGLLGFAGLVAPHLVRLLGNGGQSAYILSGSALMGGILVVAGDTLGRLLAPAGHELPAGIFLTFAGALFFIWLLLIKRGAGVWRQ